MEWSSESLDGLLRQVLDYCQQHGVHRVADLVRRVSGERVVYSPGLQDLKGDDDA